MLKLLSWPTSPFGAKVKVCLKALNLYDTVEIINYHPWQRDEDLRRLNPLNKIPVLILEDGSVLYDSPVICEYINDMGKGALIPQDQKFWILKVQALCDGILDAAVNARYETHFRPEPLRSKDWYNRQIQAVTSGLDALSLEPLDQSLTLATLVSFVTLSYLELRYPSMAREAVPEHLTIWYEEFQSTYPWLMDVAPSDSLPLPSNLTSIIQ